MPNIRLSVDYYNNIERAKFQGFPNVNILNELVDRNISIPKDEFLTYMLFTDQDDNYEGYRDYFEISYNINNRIGDLDRFVTFNNGSLQSRVSSSRMHDTRLTEKIGVGQGLCVVNKIHSLTAADWKKIPETNQHSTFDFTLKASTGNNYIQVENKGSIVGDNTDNRLVRHHYSGSYGILGKKTFVRAEEARLGIVPHGNLFYGTIGVLDENITSIAKVWLVDPPALEIMMDPQKYKLLARLHYYLDEFRKIGVREKIIKALKLRIDQITYSEDYLEYDKVQLDYKYPYPFHFFMERNNFAAFNTNEAFGRIFVVNRHQKNVPFLIAFPKALMRMIILQDFNGIINYEYISSFMKEDVQVFIQLKDIDIFDNQLSDNFKFVFNERSKYYQAVYFGKISHTNDGKIFGILDNNKIY